MTNRLKMKKLQNEKKVHLRSYLLIFVVCGRRKRTIVQKSTTLSTTQQN